MKKSTLLLPFFLILIFSCEKETQIIDPTPESKNAGSANLYFPIAPDIKSQVVSALAIVSAPDMDSIFSELSVSQTEVSGTIEEIPAGSDRKFEIFTYDIEKALTFYGKKFADVPAGEQITLEILLHPVDSTGQVIIRGIFVPEPISEKIAFERDDNGSIDIYVIDPDGDNLVNLTNTPAANEIKPRISPDGKKISFIRQQSGLSPQPFIMSIYGGEPEAVTILPGSDVGICDWSPDMEKLVTTSDVDGDHDVFIYNLISRELKQLTFNASSDWAPNWSPTGQWIAYQSNETGPFKIYLIHPDGSGKKQLIADPDMEEKWPTFSPDGDKLLIYGRSDVATWDLFVVDLDGTNLKRLMYTPEVNETLGCWSPAGDEILYVRRYGMSSRALYLIDPDGTDMRLFLDSQYNENTPHWR
jgi:WD40 repeat protein